MNDGNQDLVVEFPAGPRGFRDFLAARAVACLLGLLGIALIDQVSGTTADMRFVVGVAVLELFSTLPYYLWARRRSDRLRPIALTILTIDTGLVTVGEYFLGGENLVYGMPLYLLLVVLGAVVHSASAAFAIAFLASATFALMVLGSQLGWIPLRRGAFTAPFADVWPWSTVVVNTITTIGIAAIAGSLAGITQRALIRSRRFESELRLLNQGLEARVESAVGEIRLANESLGIRNRTLAATLHQVDLYARAVSHDLRNTITAAAESLRVARQDGPRRESYESLAAENLDRADRMLVGLRDLMRTTGTDLTGEAIDVRVILEQVVEELRAVRGGEQVPVYSSGALGVVRTRPERLMIVLRNLIGNALDHNRDVSDLAVEVGRDETGLDPIFFVRDNGIGLSPGIHGRVFEPFIRGPEAKGSGLGLGLALVHAIVTQTGGSVWVTSKERSGAVFYFSFSGHFASR